MTDLYKQKEWIEHHPGACPHCGSIDLRHTNSRPPYRHKKYLWMSWQCNNCHFRFKTVYELVAFEREFEKSPYPKLIESLPKIVRDNEGA